MHVFAYMGVYMCVGVQASIFQLPTQVWMCCFYTVALSTYFSFNALYVPSLKDTPVLADPITINTALPACHIPNPQQALPSHCAHNSMQVLHLLLLVCFWHSAAGPRPVLILHSQPCSRPAIPGCVLLFIAPSAQLARLLCITL